jgi:hypothetical protein
VEFIEDISQGLKAVSYSTSVTALITSHVVFFLVPHPLHEGRLKEACRKGMKSWYPHIRIHPAENRRPGDSRARRFEEGAGGIELKWQMKPSEVEEIKVKNIIDMAYGFTAMRRNFEANSSPKIKAKLFDVSIQLMHITDEEKHL